MAVTEPYPGVAYPGAVYPGISQTYTMPYGEWEYVSDLDIQAAIQDAYGKTTFSATVDNTVAGTSFDIDIAGVHGNYDQDWFDGDETPGALFRTAWSGTPHDSKSILSAVDVKGYIDYAGSMGVKILWDDDQPIKGSKSIRVVPDTDNARNTGAGVNSVGYVRFNPGLTSVTTIGVTLAVRIEGDPAHPVILSAEPNNVAATEQNSAMGAGTHFVSMVAVVQAGGWFYLQVPGDWNNGSIVIDQMSISRQYQSQVYIDGDSPDDVDMTYSWLGTPHDSESVATSHSTALAPFTSPFQSTLNAVRSSVWSNEGDHALRLMPLSHNTTMANMFKVADWTQLDSYTTYTVSAVRRITGHLTPDIIESGVFYTSNIAVVSYDADSDALINFSSSIVPSSLGSVRVNYTFITGEVTSSDFDEYTGVYVMGTGSEADIWWDSITVVKGSVSAEYFDGDDDDSVWQGEPHFSISHRIPVPERISGYPLKKFYSSITDRMGEVDEMVARLTYIPEDSRHEVEMYGLDLPDRAVPLGATSDLVDVRTADDAWLPWIAQLVGVNHNDVTPEQIRTSIASGLTGMVAGTRQSIIGVVQSIMREPHENRSVTIYPHTISPTAIGAGSQWDLLIVTPMEQKLTKQQVVDALVSSGAKPAGVVIHHVSHSTTWTDIHTNFPTWAHWNGHTWKTTEEASY